MTFTTIRFNIDRPFSQKIMSPRSSQKNTEIRLESMKKIADAAYTLIARQGFETTTIAQIAARAGISKGLLYNYYASKEDLLEKIVTNSLSEAEQVMAGLMTHDAAQTLENLLRYYFDELRKKPDQWRIMTELTFRIDKFTFIHDIAVQKVRGYIALLESLLQQVGMEDPRGEAKILGALFDGIAIQFLIIRDEYPLDEMEAFMINKYCKKDKT